MEILINSRATRSALPPAGLAAITHGALLSSGRAAPALPAQPMLQDRVPFTMELLCSFCSVFPLINFHKAASSSLVPPPLEPEVLLPNPVQASSPHHWKMFLLLGRVLVSSAFGNCKSFLVVLFYLCTARYIYSSTA